MEYTPIFNIQKFPELHRAAMRGIQNEDRFGKGESGKPYIAYNSSLNMYNLEFEHLLNSLGLNSIEGLLDKNKKNNVADLSGLRALTEINPDLIGRALCTSLGDGRTASIIDAYEPGGFDFMKLNFFSTEDWIQFMNYADEIGGFDLVISKLDENGNDMMPCDPVFLWRTANIVTSCLKPGGKFLTDYGFPIEFIQEAEGSDKVLSKLKRHFQTINISLDSQSQFQYFQPRDPVSESFPSTLITASANEEVQLSLRNRMREWLYSNLERNSYHK